MYSMRMCIHKFVAVALALGLPYSAHAQARRPILAVFAHPDDERVIAPLLSRLAREGRETYLVIATDGSKGVRDFAHIPAGPELAAARAKEAACAANRLGVRQLRILGLPDGGLASFEALGKLRSALAAIIDTLRPAAIITIGPDGGTDIPIIALSATSQRRSCKAMRGTRISIYCTRHCRRSVCAPHREQIPV